MQRIAVPFLTFLFIFAISTSMAGYPLGVKAGHGDAPNTTKKEEKMRDKIAKKKLAQMRIEERAIHLTVAVEEKCDDEFYSQFTKHLQKVSDLLWKITQGQFYIDSVSFKDNSWSGRIVVPKGAKNNALLSGKATGLAAQCCEPNTNRWFVLCPGKPKSEIIVTHELLHGLAKLRDENRCNCIMQGQTSGQIKPVCDKTSHRHKTKNCWNLISRRWPGAKCVNPEFKNATLPPAIQIGAKEHQEKPDGSKEKILKIDALNTRGILLIEARQYDNALVFFNKALNTDPKAPAALYNIACIYAIKGMKEKSLEYLKKALDCGFDDYELLLDDSDFKSIKADKAFGVMIEKCRKDLPGHKNAEDKRLPERK